MRELRGQEMEHQEGLPRSPEPIGCVSCWINQGGRQKPGPTRDAGVSCRASQMPAFLAVFGIAAVNCASLPVGAYFNQADDSTDSHWCFGEQLDQIG